jgi:dienelactone hydrolase
VTHAFSQAAVVCLTLYFYSCANASEAVVIENDGWRLYGDLEIPAASAASAAVPAVLMLNQAAGNRQAYEGLAAALAIKGIASLRLDLRGHGESTNLGEFRPENATAEDRETYIWNADADVIAAHRFLSNHADIDSARVGIVGASYSGEEMAEAGRNTQYAAAYVALSPGSFSDESISAMDPSSVPWLFIVSRNERFLHEIAAKVQATTSSVEILYLPGNEHATDLLASHPALAERIAAWLAAHLSR